MIEFEIKIPHAIDPVRKALKRAGAKLKKKDFNDDTYYNHPDRDFKVTDEALRIRKTSNSTSLTYKGPKFDERSKSREEIDIKFEEDGLATILERLSFTIGGQVYKDRETWILDDITITLDKVRDLGEYIEFELVSPEKAKHEVIINQLRSVISGLGLDPDTQITTSYLELLQMEQSS